MQFAAAANVSVVTFVFFFQVMDGSLPTSLKHIISNAEYYGPSLFLLGEFFLALQKVFYLESLLESPRKTLFCVIMLLLVVFPNNNNAVFLFSCLFGFVATEVVTVFVFQEPSLLSSLQDNGLTDVMLHALLIKDVSYSNLLWAI